MRSNIGKPFAGERGVAACAVREPLDQASFGKCQHARETDEQQEERDADDQEDEAHGRRQAGNHGREIEHAGDERDQHVESAVQVRESP